jgi:hypothetical protein
VDLPQTDLAELFSRDPLKLTKADVGVIVERLRASRKQFNEGVKGAGKVPNAAKAAQAALDLKELGL